MIYKRIQWKPPYKNLEFSRPGWTGSYTFWVVFHNSGDKAFNRYFYFAEVVVV